MMVSKRLPCWGSRADNKKNIISTLKQKINDRGNWQSWCILWTRLTWWRSRKWSRSIISVMKGWNFPIRATPKEVYQE